MKLKTLTILSIIVVSNYSLAQTDLIFKGSFEFVTRLNDTGITWAGEYPVGKNADCTSSTISSLQDCHHGRDVTHNDDSDGHAGFSFTKLDANGVPLVDQSVNYQTTPWACVRDNVTGLVWEVKTDDGGIHDKDNTYKWGGVTALGRDHPNRQGDYYDDWNNLVNDSNNGNGLCGFTDWRIPIIDELSGLANLGTTYPAIDLNYFPNTVPLLFWSSSPVAYNDIDARIVSFNLGNNSGNNRGIDIRVRLVRSSEQ